MVSIPQALVRSSTNSQLTAHNPGYKCTYPTYFLKDSSYIFSNTYPARYYSSSQAPHLYFCESSGTARSRRTELRFSWSESRVMTRRSNRKLHALYMSRRFRVPSPADGPGFLYAFVDSGVSWKLGMTIDYDRRKAEWERQCPCPGRVWLPPMRVLRRRKSGSKAHIEIFLIPGHCVILKDKPAKMNDIRDTFPFGYLGHRDVLMSQRPDIDDVLMSPRPDIETSQCPDVPISTTSRCPDVPTSRTPILGEIILKNLMLSTRRIFRENFNLSR
ncbi:hypothetical protein C8R41DRAFT_864500 [Lentinula lateritia]|uniref:Uncharacterized protein n=1 Tax=Lentinula lateritia TaxID=40482 RepID=A0ABQ8VT06_9AGAR|nr:hypothetical protein C8R41DRAFT_864500 [Lentinula lateritia]